MSKSKSWSALVIARASVILVVSVMAGPFPVDVEWNLHSREGAPATLWPELADSEPKHPAALAHQAQGATETVAEVA